MSRQPTHPNFGKEVRVEQDGNEVAVIFQAHTEEQANSLARNIVRQLKDGGLHLVMTGEPTSIEINGDLD